MKKSSFIQTYFLSTMSQLKVFRASAGSGKTFTLTKEYVRLLFKEPANYRHTLAVTFTNKATAEMRSRILATLYDLSDPKNDNPDHMSDLIKEFSISKQEVRKKSSALLKLLLHDYSRFSISTIDSFFQRVTRSFAREMGLPMGFRLELEANQIMQQAIDQLILEMDMPHNKEMKRWLIQFAQERIENSQSWNIAKEIKDIGGEIVKERFQSNAGMLSKQISDRNFLNTYKKALEEIVGNINNKLIGLGNQAEELIKSHGLDIESDFSGKSRSPIRVFKRMTELSGYLGWSDLTKIYNPETFLKIAGSIDSLLAKSAKNEVKSAIESVYFGGIQDIARTTAKYLLEKREDYYTAKLILPNLNALGLVNDLNEKMMELCRDQNIFLISGTNYLLTRIIDNNDTPFIYEKTGTRYSNFMIDEFQDTSTLQYLNFLPLINDSLAAGKYSLVVGDVKQAIYRWRNSDWNILAEKVENDFDKYGIDLNTLDTNWRSSKEVIQFNNLFFKFASEALQSDFNELIPEENNTPETDHLKSKITTAYNDIFQNTSPKMLSDEGQIHMQFVESENIDEFREAALYKAIERVGHLIEEGFKLSDIAILVRTNKEAVLITNALLSGEYSVDEKSYPVISNESLIIGNSEAIQLIIAQLEYLLRPNDQILETFIRLHVLKKAANSDKEAELDVSDSFLNEHSDQLWEQYKLELLKHQQKPLYELIETVSSLIPKDIYAQHAIFIQGFLSVALSFINEETADINQFITFWHNRGSRLSLSVPDDQEAIRVMTIHKSKGLEFDAVVIPFVDWKINSLKHSDFLWLKPKTEPFSAVSLVPINGVNAVALSHFADDFFDETLLNYVDTLNVGYVAFTRAKRSISLIGYVMKRNFKKIDNFSNLMLQFASSSVSQERYPSAWDEEEQVFEIGQVLPISLENVPKEETLRKVVSVLTPEIKHTPIHSRINNHLESYHSFDGSHKSQQLHHGKIMHQLFELIKDENDVDGALLQLRLQGKISGEEIEPLKTQIAEYINHPKAKNWFNNYYQIKTEATILAKNIKRPDRVMIGENEIIVVDYKFGREKSANHHAQVRQYLNLVQQIANKKALGYLWYMESNEIVEVDMQGKLF